VLTLAIHLAIAMHWGITLACTYALCIRSVQRPMTIRYQRVLARRYISYWRQARAQCTSKLEGSNPNVAARTHVRWEEHHTPPPPLLVYILDLSQTPKKKKTSSSSYHVLINLTVIRHKRRQILFLNTSNNIINQLLTIDLFIHNIMIVWFSRGILKLLTMRHSIIVIFHVCDFIFILIWRSRLLLS
jgi:hypothetical protein